MPGPFYPGYVTKGDFSQVSSTQEHELGTLGYASNGRIMEYVLFTQNLMRFNWVGRDLTNSTVNRAKTAAMLRNAATHAPIGVAEYGGTANSYGWITRYGPATAKVNDTAAHIAGQGMALFNDAQATGTLGAVSGAFTTATGLLNSMGTRGGILCGTANATAGTIVDVNCL